MAGSYRHVTDAEGKFSGMDCIDNLGDAHEALEECVDMIMWLATQLTAGDPRWMIWAAHNQLPEIKYPPSFEEFWEE